MSLDVHLMGPMEVTPCPHCGHDMETQDCLYSANIMGQMADAAGIYEALWRPENKGWVTARDITPTLETGLAWLKRDPGFFRDFDAPNGWGLYEHFVPFVERYLQACRESPDAVIAVSR